MKKKKNKSELTTILHLLRVGLTKQKIREKLEISKSNFSNYLGKLEKLGYIKREGKFKVNVLTSSLSHPRVTLIPVDKKLNKRGHAFNFKILFPSEENLKKKQLVKEFLNRKPRKGKNFKRVPTVLPFGSIKFSFKRNTIWINKESLTIYTNNSYYSKDALHSKFRALQDIDNLTNQLKVKFGFKGIYGIEIFREHYGLIFNKFAEWLLSQKRKLDVKNMKNKSILWVDDSKEDDIGLKEFEADKPLRANKSDEYFKECDETDWKVTPKFTLEAINKVTANQVMFDKNFQSHLEVIKKLGIAVDELREEIKRLKN